MSRIVDHDDAAVAGPIKCILSDVDGVMTDGRIIYDSLGAETKQFHVRDGLGIKQWMNAGLTFGIITARSSPMVQRRADELGIQHVIQGAGNKLERAQQVLEEIGLGFDSLCYIGDDLPDRPVLQQAALAACPADAAADVKNVSDWIMQQRGGEGAVRELVERLLRAQGQWHV